jgi:hypothetical protein
MLCIDITLAILMFGFEGVGEGVWEVVSAEDRVVWMQSILKNK